MFSEEKAKEKVQETLDALERAGESFRKGLMSRDECLGAMMRAFHDGFSGFLQSEGLMIGTDRASYENLKEDWPEYLRSGRASAECGPWLLLRKGGQTAPEERRLVMYMMEQYCLGPGFFEPAPEELAKPGRIYVHGYHGSTVYAVPFRCEDDGGLLSSEDAEGKSFVPVSDLGLRAFLTVREDRRKKDRTGMDFDEMVFDTGSGLAVRKAPFLAEGYIEGYTAGERKGNRDILVRTDGEGKIYMLAYCSGPEDEKAFEGFPLWQGFFSWAEKKEERDRAMLSVLFGRYMQIRSAEKG